jgi:hypothetical protein
MEKMSLYYLYNKFFEIKGIITIPEEWEGEYRSYFIEQYKIYGNGARGFAKKFFMRKKLQTQYPDEWSYFVGYIKQKYEVEGVGLKLLAKDVGISYTKMRRLLEHNMPITLRKGRNVVTENLKKVRSDNAKKMGGWRNKRTKNKNTERGVQGYYHSKSMNKSVWLRSTYEFIFAKWLDSNKIIWDVECKTWMLNNESYRPDFFIYENEELIKIVEVKGYFKNRVWKFEELKKVPELKGVEFCLVDDIEPFLLGSTYLGELKWWKKNRLLEIKS